MRVVWLTVNSTCTATGETSPQYIGSRIWRKRTSHLEQLCNQISMLESGWNQLRPRLEGIERKRVLRIQDIFKKNKTQQMTKIFFSFEVSFPMNSTATLPFTKVSLHDSFFLVKYPSIIFLTLAFLPAIVNQVKISWQWVTLVVKYRMELDRLFSDNFSLGWSWYKPILLKCGLETETNLHCSNTGPQWLTVGLPHRPWVLENERDSPPQSGLCSRRSSRPPAAPASGRWRPWRTAAATGGCSGASLWNQGEASGACFYQKKKKKILFNTAMKKKRKPSYRSTSSQKSRWGSSWSRPDTPAPHQTPAARRR